MPYYSVDSDTDMSLCRDILEILDRHYPGFPWGVEVNGGVVIIRNALFGPKWGMVSHFHDVAHDAKSREKEIVLMAGEFLERGGFRRGRWDGHSIPKGLEGKKFNPLEGMILPGG